MKGTRRTRRTARQLFRLCVVDGRLDDARVRTVADGVAASTRRGSLSVLADFHRMVRLARDRRAALIESAAPLSDELRRDVQRRLEARYGGALTASFAENPALIGGMRIRVGSDVFDGSVRARIAAIGAAFEAR